MRDYSLLFLLAAQLKGFDLRAIEWMAGDWFFASGKSVVEEHWTKAAGDTMIGMGRTVRDGRTTSFEYTRLETRNGEIYYIAMPNAKKTAEFKLVKSSPTEAVFEGGDEHVQRLIYRNSDPTGMTARVEGMQDGRSFSQEFQYKRAVTEKP